MHTPPKQTTNWFEFRDFNWKFDSTHYTKGRPADIVYVQRSQQLYEFFFFFFVIGQVVCWQLRKFPKYSDTEKICCNRSKIWTMWFYHRVMSPNDADGMANSVDPDQTASLGAVWSGSALFAQAYLSENLGSLR